MANERLRAALDRRRTTVEALAIVTEVDPKTVHRWLGGRTPHPRHRFQVAKYLNDDEEFLWPGARRSPTDESGSAAELVGGYAYRSDLPTSKWWELITTADRQIDLLGYTLYFLPMQHPHLIEVLREKCAAGCRIRAAIADPSSPHVAYRDAEEDLAMTLVVRIQTTMKYLQDLADSPNFELRFQDVPLYNSIFRFDDEMLVTPHLYATPGSSAPLLHFRRLVPNGMFSRFAGHFDSVWSTTIPIASRNSDARIRVEV